MELLRAGARWFTLPWKQWTVVAAVIASTAAPVSLAASADLWLVGEQDVLTRLVLDGESLDENGIDVSLEAAFAPEPFALADRQLVDDARSIAELGEVTRLVYTLPGLLAIAPESPGEIVRTVGPSGRLLARAGALDNVTIVDQLDDVERGVWITTHFSERHDLELGDGLGFEAGAIADEQWNDIVQGGGADSIFRIVGTYEPLWSDAVNPDHESYWADVPPELIPRFLDAGIGPSSELVLAAESTVLDSGLTGVARWTAPLSRWPTDFAGLRSLDASLGRFEARLIGVGPLAESMLGLATQAQASPRLTTEIDATTATVRDAAARLDAPLRTARSIGTVVGLLAMAAVGIFFTQRNRVSFRLLVAEGTSTLGVGVRVAAMLAAPVAVGTGLGLLAASPMVSFVGPDRAPGLDGVDALPALVVALAALALVSAVAAVWAMRSARPLAPDTARAVTAATAIGVIVIAVFTWVQVGPTSPPAGNTVDLALVMLPLVVTTAGLVVALALVGLLGRSAAANAEELPTIGFLAVSRVTTSGTSLRITSLVLGLGIGMVVFSTAFVDTLDRTVDLKLASEIGGTSRVQIIDPLPAGTDLAASTVVRESDTALTASGQRILVLAVDRSTFADAVDWPVEFGLDPSSALTALAEPVGDRVAAIAIDGQSVPDRSAFGFTQSFPFDVVQRVQSLPGAASGRATLLVIGDDLDELALRRAGFDTLDQTTGTTYRPPTDRFRRVVLSQRSLDSVLSELGSLDIRTRDPASQEGRRNAPDVVAARSAFGYLGLLGAVAATGAASALMASLAARRRQRSLSAVMLRSMGFGAGRSATTTLLEVGALVAVTTAVAAAIAPLTIERVAAHFDPSPGRPPSTTVDIAWLSLASSGAVILMVIGSILWLVEWRAGRRLAAEVLDEH